MDYNDLLNIELPKDRKYRIDKENEIDKMMIEYEGEIEIISTYLSNILFERVGVEAIIMDEELKEVPEKFQEAFEEIRDVFENEESIIGSSVIENICLCRAIGKNIAEKTDDKFHLWGDILNLIDEQYIIYKSWVENISESAIKKNREEIYKVSKYDHPLELIRTWGYFRDRSYWDSFDENNRINKEKFKDPWSYVESVIRYGDEFRLSTELKFKSDLLRKLGLKEWILWVKDLPLIQIRYVLVLEVQSANEAQELLTVIIKLEGVEDKEKEELLCLVIHYIIVLLSDINNNLNHYAEGKWAYFEEDKSFSKECEQKLDEWDKEYLPNYITKLVDNILNNGGTPGKNVLIYMLRHINVRNERDKIIGKVRTGIVDSIVRGSLEVEDIIGSIGKEHLNTKTTLNSLILLFSSEKVTQEDKETIFKKMWNDYYELLEEKNYWHIPLNPNYDDHKLMWLMAGVLSNFDNPRTKLEELLAEVYIATEGWGYDIKDHYSSISNTAHVLVVGVMAIEWMRYNRPNDVTEGMELFDFVWNFTQTWIRTLVYQPDQINELLIQLWARVPLVYDELKGQIVQALEDMDSLEHILVCSQVFLSNIDGLKLDTSDNEAIKELVNNKFNTLFPIINQLYAVDGTKVEWYNSLRDNILQLGKQ